MDTYRIIDRLSSDSKITKLEIASAIGMTPQGMYKALKNNISFNQMSDAIERCGYVLLIGKLEDGKVTGVRRASEYSKA